MVDTLGGTDQPDDRWWLAAVAEQTHEALIGLGLGSQIVAWNFGAERIFGYAAAEIRGSNAGRLIPPDRRQEVAALWGKLSAGEAGLSCQTVWLRKDSAPVEVALTASPVRDSGGQLIAAALLLREARAAGPEGEDSHLERWEFARGARMTALGQLSASIAHELNQPLCAITTNADLCLQWLMGGAPDLAELEIALVDIVQAAYLASQVTARIRGFLKGGESRRAPLDLNKVACETISIVRHEVRQRDIRLSAELAADLPPVVGDRVELQQVILNLLLNAIEALEAGAGPAREILLSSRVDATGGAQMSIHDSGVGLSPCDCDRIFDAFYTTKPNGLGLGLSINRSIIEAHGGRLWVTPNDGPGTTFHFVLPRE
jgi:PAS domain S-box-containing protein